MITVKHYKRHIVIELLFSLHGECAFVLCGEVKIGV